MKKEFGLDTSDLITFDDFTDICFRSITSIKIWDTQLKLAKMCQLAQLSI